VLVVGIFLGLWYAAWNGVRRHVLHSADYWLTSYNVEITPLPNWIRSDIRAEVFRDASLDGPLSIMDAHLTDRIAAAFSLHPWVAEVRRVTKYHPARVRAELVYRKPVCMVEVPGRLLPVDERGVLLPAADFSQVEAREYPCLVGIRTVPVGPAGEHWGDARVVGAAEIAAVFGAAWQELKLDRIVPLGPVRLAPGEEHTYALFTRGGTRILWGRAPGTDMPGETPAVDKVARLRNYAKEHGALDDPRGPQQIDVRGRHALRFSHRAAGQPEAPAR
jgi:hypothetical protein